MKVAKFDDEGGPFATAEEGITPAHKSWFITKSNVVDIPCDESIPYYRFISRFVPITAMSDEEYQEEIHNNICLEIDAVMDAEKERLKKDVRETEFTKAYYVVS